MDYNINLTNINKYNQSTEVPSYSVEDTDESIFPLSGNEEAPNGEIEFSIQSKKTGDCWLLAAVNSLSYSDKGSKIIRDSIKFNDDGTYSVYFKGVNAEVIISENKLREAEATGLYSEGDDDVLLMEIGMDTVIDKINEGEIKIKGYHPYITMTNREGIEGISINGGSFLDAIFLLTGDNTLTCTNPSLYYGILDNLDTKTTAVAVFGPGNGHENEVIQDIYGNNIYTIPEDNDHDFSIKSADKDTVVIVNPNDSSKEYVISKDTLKKYAKSLDFYVR